jgi:signal transduction histidine kinase
LAATIEWHVRQFQNCTGIPCELTVNNAAGFNLAEDLAETIFDIYTEALSNVARHAAASHVAIVLSIMPHEVRLVVADNGVGLGDAADASGAGGLAVIRAHAETYKGSCEVGGTPNGGTTVTVSLPIP